MPKAHNKGTTVESWPLYTKKLAEGAMSFFPSGSGRLVLCNNNNSNNNNSNNNNNT